MRIPFLNRDPQDWVKRAIEAVQDDASKADVLKAHIAAASSVEQVRITETEATNLKKASDSDYLLYRFWWRFCTCAVLVAFAGFAGCEYDKSLAVKQDIAEKQAQVEQTRIQAEHPGSFVCPPAPACPPPGMALVAVPTVPAK